MDPMDRIPHHPWPGKRTSCWDGGVYLLSRCDITQIAVEAIVNLAILPSSAVAA